MTFTTRFAPSPTGPLHLGHAYSALVGYEMAQKRGGTFHLRIDDLDQSRARAKWEEQFKDDLEWLGLDWSKPCRRQSDVQTEYDAALNRLWDMGLLYPCHCSRRDIRGAMSAPQEGVPIHGPDGLIYPGTCRKTPSGSRPDDVTLRLDMARACAVFSGDICFQETGITEREYHVSPQEMTEGVGDIVVARKDMGASYHLAVVVDDNAQQISHVIRGADLFDATKIHVLLQGLLGLPTPIYHHHDLIRDDAGKRLAKRDDARAIATYRDDGASPDELRAMIGL